MAQTRRKTRARDSPLPDQEKLTVEQRAIYDERYRGSGYDERSAVRVLTAEERVLHEATVRAAESLPGADPLSLLDFGYGTGRISNEFASQFSKKYKRLKRNLRLVAYDISAVGLKKAADSLFNICGFDTSVDFDRNAAVGYVAGTTQRLEDGISVEIVFVHGNEYEDCDTVRKLLEGANGGRSFSMTTSWYSALAHLPSADQRARFFAMLAGVTEARGELLIAPSVSGDLVELQAEWAERLRRGEIGDHPIEGPGDVIYRTELAQENFYHVFGPDLAELLEASRAPGQRTWLEAVRLPDPEFASRAAEQDNYLRVQEFNRRLNGRPWGPDDFRQVHTAVAIRSGHPGWDESSR
jgi:hypothetical protein